MAQFFPPLSTIQNERTYRLRLLGVNGANPTKQVGAGMTVTRTSEGLYKITWAKDPFRFIGCGHSFGSVTMTDMADYTFVRGVYNATAHTLEFSIIKQNGTVEDLVANQFLDVDVTFSEAAA